MVRWSSRIWRLLANTPNGCVSLRRLMAKSQKVNEACSPCPTIDCLSLSGPAPASLEHKSSHLELCRAPHQPRTLTCFPFWPMFVSATPNSSKAIGSQLSGKRALAKPTWGCKRADSSKHVPKHLLPTLFLGSGSVLRELEHHDGTCTMALLSFSDFLRLPLPLARLHTECHEVIPRGRSALRRTHPQTLSRLDLPGSKRLLGRLHV